MTDDKLGQDVFAAVRTGSGPRQRTLCYLGELNGSAQARWLKSVEVFNEQGEAQQLKSSLRISKYRTMIRRWRESYLDSWCEHARWRWR